MKKYTFISSLVWLIAAAMNILGSDVSPTVAGSDVSPTVAGSDVSPTVA